MLPVYESQRKPLAAMTGVLGFLLLAWLFYIRRTIALGSITRGFRWIFNLSPLLLILGSITCYVSYFTSLDQSLIQVSRQNASIKRLAALNTWGQENSIPDSALLQVLYLGIFLCAEAAFVMMALREYANDVNGISEHTWMFGEQDGSGIPIAGSVKGQQATELPPKA